MYPEEKKKWGCPIKSALTIMPKRILIVPAATIIPIVKIYGRI